MDETSMVEEMTHGVAYLPEPRLHLHNICLAGLIPRPAAVLEGAEADLSRVEQADDVLSSMSALRSK